MSAADTIRNFIYDDSRCVPADIPEFQAQDEADAALDALVAEIERLRDALEQIASPLVVSDQSSIDTLAFCVRTARDALAATPSEDTDAEPFDVSGLDSHDPADALNEEGRGAAPSEDTA